MFILLAILMLVVLAANLIVYGGLFWLIRCAVGGLLTRLAPERRARWPCNWIAAGGCVVIVTVLPLVLNHFHREARATMAAGDLAWTGSLRQTPNLALLLDTGEAAPPDDCTTAFCQTLVYHRAVGALLLAKPPPFDAPLDPAMDVMRYRIDQRAFCPRVVNKYHRFDGMTLDELAAAAMGQCLIGEPATLNNADIVVMAQLSPRSRMTVQTVHEAAYGQRLTIYRRDGESWHKLLQQTGVGGYDWFVPLLVGPLDRGSYALFDSIGFAIGHTVKLNYFNAVKELDHFGLGGPRQPMATKEEMAALAKKSLADDSLPPASAAMQFLAAYPWLGGWRKDDLDTIAAIIRDRRVTEFPSLWVREPTPAVLAQPIIDRISAIDLSPQNPDHNRNLNAIEILSEAFGRLSTCAAAPFHADLQRLADDKERRPFLAPMLRRLADTELGCDAKTSP